jgi:uncharacterized membrane protein YjjP (DUF1212 family)
MSTSVATLCVRLALALSSCGAPVHRIEAALEQVLRAYGLEGAVVASPTAVWLQVGDQTRVLRVNPGEVHLAALVRVLRLVDRIEGSTLSPLDAVAALERVQAALAPWPVAVERVAFIATSASAAGLLGGGAQDVLGAAGAGALAMALLPLLGRQTSWHPLREGVLATVLGAWGALTASIGASPMIVALSGAILVVPGLSLTTGIIEAAAGHWSTGSARLLGATVALVQLAVGVSIGWWLVGDLAPTAYSLPLPMTVARFVPLFAPAFIAVLLRARPQDLPAVWLTAVIGWSVAEGIGGVLGAAAAATTVGALARVLGRVLRLPDLTLILPGVLLLVPGTVGVKGIDRLIAHDMDGGLQTALAALEVACALAGGLFAGQALAQSADAAMRRSSGAPRSVAL